MCILGRSRQLKSHVARVSSSRSSNHLRASRRAWWALADRSAQTPVGYDSTVQHPATGIRNGDPGEQDSSHQPRWWHPWKRRTDDVTTNPPTCRTGTHRPDILAALDVTQPPGRLAQHHALDVPPPARSAHGPAPANRVRVVLLPHPRTKPTDTQTHNHHTT